MMDYLYGELLDRVTPVEYEGKDTETAKITVDNDSKEISVQVPFLDKSVIKEGSFVDTTTKSIINVISSTEDGVYSLEATIKEGKVSLQYGTKLADNEKSRAESIEGNLQDLNPELDKSNLVAAINSEYERASNIEKNLEAALLKEIERAKDTEGNLTELNEGLSQSSLVSAINSENERAKAAEDAINTRLGSNEELNTESTDTVVDALNEVNTNLKTEINRAKTAEGNLELPEELAASNLTEGITKEYERATAVEGRLDDLETAVKSSLVAAINSEVARAKQAETDITTSLNSTNTELTKKIEDGLNTEKERAEAAEKTLTDNLNTEANERKAADTEINNKIGDSFDSSNTVAKVIESTKTSLEQSIQAERTRAEEVEQNLQTAIDNEKSRAEGVESGLNTRVTAIEGKIPTQASAENQLADKAFVNSSINNFAAFYITKDEQGNPFDTHAQLFAATTFYSGGQVRIPTTNDYAIVLADETKKDELGQAPTTRYTYQQSQWEYQYIINRTALTAAQVAAINSNITAELTAQITINKNDIAGIKTKNDAQDAQLRSHDTDITSLQAGIGTMSSTLDQAAKDATAAKKLATSNEGRIDTLETKSTLQDSAINDLDSKKVDKSGGDLKDTVVTFTDYAVDDSNVASGEKTSTLFGKIKRWLGRLKKLAFKDTITTADIDDGAVTAEKLGSNVQTALQQIMEYANKDAFPPVGDSGKIYIANDTNVPYRWDGAKYMALSVPPTVDGKILASQITIGKDITLAGIYDAVGNIEKSRDGEILDSANMSLEEFLTKMLTKELPPSITTYPSVTGFRMDNAGSVEVGTKYSSITAGTLALNPGSYEYGPTTGVKANAYRIYRILGTQETRVSDSASVSDTNDGAGFTVGDDTTLKYRGEIDYSEGVLAYTNLGNTTYTEGGQQKTLKIPASTATSVTSTLSGYRQYFYGSVTTTLPPQGSNINSALIRNLRGSGRAYASGTFTLNVSPGTTAIYIACIDGKTGPTVVYNTSNNQYLINGSQSVFTKAVVQVAGANDYVPTNYNVWYYVPEIPFETAAVLNVTLS